MIPSFVSVKPNVAVSSATTASAIAAPCTRTITGFGQRSIARNMSDIASASRMLPSSPRASAPRIQLMSAPPQKVFPSPSSTTTRTVGSVPSAVNASRSCAISSALKAFRTPGRASTTRARAPSRSTRRTLSGTGSLVRRGVGPGPSEAALMRFRRFAAAALAVAFLAAPPARSVDVTRATLANGLQVVVLRDTLAPVVSTWMNYLTGSDEEAITGIAHAQEHMLFRGSKTLTASQFADTTAVTGGTFNADTQNEMTQYFFEMPSQYLDVALNLERSRATGVLDSQKLWDQERGAITQEVTQDYSSATFRLFFKSIQHIFAGTPYANFGLGTVDSFKRIQAKDLKAFYDRWYHPNNAVYVIAGNVDPQATIAKVKALFGTIPTAKLPARNPVHLQAPTPLTLHDNSSDPITLGFVAYRVPGYEDKDYFASQILNDVLNSQRGALYELQASGKALGTFAQSVTYPKAGMTLVGSAVPVTTTGEKAVSDVKDVIEAYKKSGLPAELVEVAKQREVAQAQFARNSINGLATTWSQTLAVEHRTPDEELAGLQAVTVDDVNRVLRTYYDQTTATIAISTPKEAAGSAFGGRQGEDNTFIPTEHTGLPAFAKNILNNLHVPESTVKPVAQTLPSGLKLIVVPSTISKTVLVRGEIVN